MDHYSAGDKGRTAGGAVPRSDGRLRAVDDSTVIRHGGDLDEADATFPGGPRPWIDLSTGINPVPYPLPPLAPECFERLPTSAELAAVEQEAAHAYGVKDPGVVVAAPGTQTLIGLLPRLRPQGSVAVLGPTYGEHAAAWLRGGHRVAEARSPDELPDAQVLVVVNPNNPDGRTLTLDDLRRLAGRAVQREGWLVVDEAFADLEEVASLASDPPENTILLRSFGKTYGLAGLRLGFAIAPPAIATALRQALGPWPLSGPAIAIGRLALTDAAWRRAAARARAADALRLDQAMAAVADRVVGGTRLFRLYELARAAALFDHLGRNGIWVRRFQRNPAWLRFGLPASASAWACLEEALGTLV
jgi:cobalamin biosynthetic protein CobC